MLASLFAILPLLAITASASPIERRANNVQIHPNGDTSQCLLVRPIGGQVTNDTPVVVGSCSEPNTLNNFDISYGDNLSVKLSGSNFCLDAGVNPNSNNQLVKMYTCYPGLQQQHWYLTNDNHIAITGGTTCLDRQNGGTLAQVYSCIGGNTNQIWTISGGSTPPPPSTTTTMMASTTVATTASSTSTGSTTPPPTGGAVVHFNGDNSQCLTVQPDQPIAAGSDINVVTCPKDNSLDTRDKFLFSRGQTTFKLASDSTLCVDFGNDVNGSKVKIQKCNGGASQNLYCESHNS